MSKLHQVQSVFRVKINAIIKWFKSLFKRKEIEPEFKDKGLPLGLHIDGKISINMIDLFVHLDKLKFVPPSEDCYIKSYGTFKIATSIGYRFYMESGNGNYILLIVTDQDGVIEECKILGNSDSFFLTSKNSFDEWLGDKGNIGWWCYPPTEVEDDAEYMRVWCEDSDDDRVDPIEYSETIYRDRMGTKIENVDHRAFLYGKWIDEESDVAEFCLLSAKEYLDESIEVEKMYGVNLSSILIKILF